MFERIAAVYDGTPCCTHVGPDGAGHFVKMVHNGIEYADMQLIGEAYDLLRQGLGLPPGELAAIFEQWNEGDLDSFLIQITAEVLGHVDAATGRPFVDVILDQAEQKGTGRWTVQAALELAVPVTGIAEAVFARIVSAHPEQRRAAAGMPGPSGSVPAGQREELVEDVRQALYASKVVADAQGFWQMAAGSEEYRWGIDLGAMATIWRAGCIIRARFLGRIRDAYANDPGLPNLLVDGYFSDAVERAQDGWRRVIGTAASLGVPVPGFSSALAYYDQLRRDRLPAALIQGLRDYFGAHTYRRVDRDGVFHTLWGGDRTEVEAG
jgi:6-phosphogluconate dehydrogenase